MIIIDVTYKSPLEQYLPRIDQYLAAHREWVKSLYDHGYMLISGPKDPRTGGIMIIKNLSLEACQELITHDPFYQQNLAEYKLTYFLSNRAIEPLRPIVEQPLPEY